MREKLVTEHVEELNPVETRAERHRVIAPIHRVLHARELMERVEGARIGQLH